LQVTMLKKRTYNLFFLHKFLLDWIYIYFTRFSIYCTTSRKFCGLNLHGMKKKKTYWLNMCHTTKTLSTI
jgi:hypothetical protein